MIIFYSFTLPVFIVIQIYPTFNAICRSKPRINVFFEGLTASKRLKKVYLHYGYFLFLIKTDKLDNVN